MNVVINLYSFNDFVGYMVYMDAKGYTLCNGDKLVPASFEVWNETGRGTYVIENHKSKIITRATQRYVSENSPTIIPYKEKLDYVGQYEPIKRDLKLEMLTEEERQVMKKEAFDALVKPQHRMGEDDTKKDDIYHPNHYTSGGIEPIQYIQSHNMNYEKGNVIKYITRAGKKEGESEIKDLKKAQNYIQLLITKLEEEEK
ncbi:DUF3310 domain-containing protein [Listeria monocytogenes]|uniref:DUF3310 domain-containing protein n=1 Tax=Listeria monocytogenes TaxID=1639 RepID=UPI001121EA63|nr:DUF3310 domain-containing protein [Listeria monocytogenes]